MTGDPEDPSVGEPLPSTGRCDRSCRAAARAFRLRLRRLTPRQACGHPRSAMSLLAPRHGLQTGGRLCTPRRPRAPTHLLRVAPATQRLRLGKKPRATGSRPLHDKRGFWPQLQDLGARVFFKSRGNFHFHPLSPKISISPQPNSAKPSNLAQRAIIFYCHVLCSIHTLFTYNFKD